MASPTEALGGLHVGAAEQSLGLHEPGVPRDVVGEGVAHEVRMHMRGDPGAGGDAVHGALSKRSIVDTVMGTKPRDSNSRA